MTHIKHRNAERQASKLTFGPRDHIVTSPTSSGTEQDKVQRPHAKRAGCPASPTYGWRKTAGRILALTAVTGSLAFNTGCEMIQAQVDGLMGSDPAAELGPGMESLQQGDLPAAAEAFERAHTADPTSVDAAIAKSYAELLRGDLPAADATLAAVEEHADPEQLKGLYLRRAMVKLAGRENSDQLEQAKKLAQASELPEGLLLAAELHLVELEFDDAKALLERVKDQPERVGRVANEYLRILNSEHQSIQLMAEVTALWAIGFRAEACSSAEDLVKEFPESDAKEVELLLWAGRAVTSDRPAVAESLLSAITFPPEGQQWRVLATKAMVALAKGENDAAVAQFATLRDGMKEGTVPRDGLVDALATACALAPDKAVARSLVEGLESPAVARCLLHADARAEAISQSTDGSFKTFLEAK